MTFGEYCEIVFRTMEDYCQLHLEHAPHLVWLHRDYNWINLVYRPIWESMNEMVEAQTPEALVTAVQWVSHLNHAGGNLMRDYRIDRWDKNKIVDSMYKLDQMEQEGLDAAFPNWEREIQKVLGTFQIRCLDIEPPEVLLDYVSRRLINVVLD